MKARDVDWSTRSRVHRRQEGIFAGMHIEAYWAEKAGQRHWVCPECKQVLRLIGEPLIRMGGKP